MSLSIRGPNGVIVNVDGWQNLSVFLGNSARATYLVGVSGLANTASSDIIAVEAGPVHYTRIRLIRLINPGTQTTAALRNLQVIRTTSAGVGGLIVPAQVDTLSDTPFSGLVRSKPTPLGAAGTVLTPFPILVPTALAQSAGIDLWRNESQAFKDILIPPGSTNGVAIRDPGAAGAANLSMMLVLTEE